MNIEEIERMREEELEATRRILEEKLKRLLGDLRRYYQILPEECWMSEESQAKKMNRGRVRKEKVGRGKIQKFKTRLQEKGLIFIAKTNNGKRRNLKHIVYKTLPIILRRLGLGFEEETNSINTPENKDYFTSNIYKNLYERFEIEQDEICPFPTVNWNVNWQLLRSHKAEELNRMEKIEKVLLYIGCGLVVLPTHYPIFENERVRCSCNLGADCSHIGKHSAIKYARLNHFNYYQSKKWIIQMFRKNPHWNIGFKVSGFSVLDVDNRHGGDRSLAKLESDFGVSFAGALSVQCSNGKHIYCSNTNLPNNAGKLGDGLDIRSEDGFIVAPGSQHWSRRAYLWNHLGSLGRMPTEWFEMDATIEPNRGFKCFTSPASTIEPTQSLLPKKLTPNYLIPEGQRNSELCRWARWERGKGANAEEIFDKLVSIRDEHCAKGGHQVSDVEIQAIADSVVKKFRPDKDRPNSNN
jgi:hypothetical protein